MAYSKISSLESGFKKLWIRMPDSRIRVDGNRIRKEKVADSRVSGYVRTGKDVFERRTSTGSEAFSLFICLDANKLVLLSFFSLLKTIYPRVSTKPLSNDAKSPLPVDVCRSKTLLLKLPIITGCAP